MPRQISIKFHPCTWYYISANRFFPQETPVNKMWLIKTTFFLVKNSFWSTSRKGNLESPIYHALCTIGIVKLWAQHMESIKIQTLFYCLVLCFSLHILLCNHWMLHYMFFLHSCSDTFACLHFLGIPAKTFNTPNWKFPHYTWQHMQW